MGEVSSCKLPPPTLRIDKARERIKTRLRNTTGPGCCFSIPTMLMVGRHPETELKEGSEQS